MWSLLCDVRTVLFSSRKCCLSDTLRWSIVWLLQASFAVSVMAQSASSVVLTPTITPSSCAANGEINVTLSGIDPKKYDISYSLTPRVENGTLILPTSQLPLRNIAAGTYTLRMMAQPLGRNESPIEVSQEVVMTSTYKDFSAELNQQLSIRSYEPCGTGRIVIGIKGGNPDTDYQFRVVRAPSPLTAGQVLTATREAGTGINYRMEGDRYPAGDYQVEVTDGCAKGVMVNFTLQAMGSTEFPEWHRILPEEADVKDKNVDYCSKVYIRPQLRGGVNAKDVERLFEEGAYEVSMAEMNATPTEWKTLRPKEVLDFSLGGFRTSQFYWFQKKASMFFYLRPKACPEQVYKKEVGFESGTIHLNPEEIDCHHYFIKANLGYPYVIQWCYPVTLQLRDLATNELLPQQVQFTKPTDEVRLMAEYGKNYHIVAVDGNGDQWKNVGVYYFDYAAARPSWRAISDLYRYPHRVDVSYLRHCADYEATFNLPTLKGCFPLTLELVDKATGRVEQTQVINTTEGIRFEHLRYGTHYLLRTTLPGDTAPLHLREFQKDDDYRFTIDQEAGYVARPNVGVFQVMVPAFAGKLPVNFHVSGPNFEKDYTVVPESDSIWTRVRDSNGRNYEPELAPGLYTATFTSPCGNQKVVTFEWKGNIEVHDFAANGTITCKGMTLRPSGYITLAGVRQPVYFRIVRGPNNFQTAYVKEGTSIELTEMGQYTLEITHRAQYGWYYGRIDVDFHRTPLRLQQARTIAYACDEGEIGHIFVKAENGTPPYRYELRSATAQRELLMAEPSDVSAEGTAHFAYGRSGETYVVRFFDDCGSWEDQAITIGQLQNTPVLLAQRTECCVGEEIFFEAFQWGRYEWRKDGVVISRAASLHIPHALTSDSGDYTITVYPPYCTQGKSDTIHVEVHPCFAPVNPQLMQRTSR